MEREWEGEGGGRKDWNDREREGGGREREGRER